LTAAAAGEVDLDGDAARTVAEAAQQAPRFSLTPDALPVSWMRSISVPREGLR
jgi:hypothetical protein